MKKLRRFWKNFWSVLKRPEMLVLPGQLAFFFILSIVPILTLISYGASSLNLSIDFIDQFLVKAFGSDVAKLVVPIVSIDKISLSFFITLFVGYFIASNGASSIIVTSNTIYGIEDKGYIYRKVKALVMTIFIVILFLFILIVPLFGDKIIELLKYVNIDNKVTVNIELLVTVLRGPISWLIIFIIIKILYTMAPDRKIPSSAVNYGALFTSIGWIMATGIYSYYINNFAHYSKFYGGLASLVVLLLWFYLLAYIFVIGMALNNKEEVVKLEETAKLDAINKVVELKEEMEENTKNKEEKIDNNNNEVKS